MKQSGQRLLFYSVPILCLLLLAFFGWQQRRPGPLPAAGPPTIMLLCGAAMRPPVAEIIDAFQRRTGIRVEVQYGASNLLLGQLELTRQGDVFLPGDAFYTTEAGHLGLVTETRTIAWFVPVIQVARGNPKGIATVADLAGDGIRLALADERAAAIGRITAEIFQANGVSPEAVRRNLEFTAVTGPELGQSIALGHADAAIIWKPVARQYPTTESIAIPAERNRLSPIEAAVLTTATATEAAREFLKFLTSPAARDVFQHHHYDLPLETASQPEPQS